MPEINRSIFKAYDIRGRYPDELNESAAKQIAFALAKKFRKGTIVLGRDCRLSSPSIYKVIEGVFLRSGFRVEPLGVCTTPMFYFSARNLRAAGVMVTASHTPKEFNGLKLVNEKGEVISGEQILKWIPLEAARSK